MSTYVQTLGEVTPRGLESDRHDLDFFYFK